jgi:hypothetical protein
MNEPAKRFDRSSLWLAAAGVGGTLLGTVITAWVSMASHQGDINAKMVELGIGTLRSEPSPETTPLREWAIDAMEKHGGFSFDLEQSDSPHDTHAVCGGIVSEPTFTGPLPGSFRRPPPPR